MFGTKELTSPDGMDRPVQYDSLSPHMEWTDQCNTTVCHLIWNGQCSGIRQFVTSYGMDRPVYTFHAVYDVTKSRNITGENGYRQIVASAQSACTNTHTHTKQRTVGITMTLLNRDILKVGSS